MRRMTLVVVRLVMTIFLVLFSAVEITMSHAWPLLAPVCWIPSQRLILLFCVVLTVVQKYVMSCRPCGVAWALTMATELTAPKQIVVRFCCVQA
jgi:hypothetical protein